MGSQKKHGTNDSNVDEILREIERLKGQMPRAEWDQLKLKWEALNVAKRLALGPDASRRKAWRLIRNQREVQLREKLFKA